MNHHTPTRTILTLLASPLFICSGLHAEPMRQHLVCSQSQNNATPAALDTPTTAFAALKEKIPPIKTRAWGTDTSPEKLTKNFTLSSLVNFAPKKDPDLYLSLQALLEILKADDIFIIDSCAI